MGTVVTGHVAEVQIEQREWNGDSWVETTVHVQEGRHMTPCRVGKDFPKSELPKQGEDVALEVVVSAWQSKRGNVGTQVTAIGRVRAIESTLFAKSGPVAAPRAS